MRREKTCNLRIDFHPSMQHNIQQLRASNGTVKQCVMRFIMNLYYGGYRHFVIYLHEPSDLWIAEILYFLTISYKESRICYSIGILLDSEDPYLWLDDTFMFRDEIFRNAKKIFWRSVKWYDNDNELKYLYVKEGKFFS